MTKILNIIHLYRREERLQLVNNQLIQQNIKACFWPGILDLENPKRGIAKAHKQIVNYARQQNLPSVTIAEDDIKFTALGAFEYFVKNEPTNYDIYLGGIYYGDIKTDNTVKDFSGLTLYMINQKFYNTFLTIPEGKDIDRELADKGRFFVSNPFVAIQHNGFSDNKKRDINYDCYLKNRKLFGQL